MRTLGTLALTLTLAGCGGAGVPAPPADLFADEPGNVTASPQIGALRIPAIDVDTQLVGLGLTPSGDHEVPPLSEPQTAGWYTLGVAPGDVGPAVLLGHVNGGGRKGVFAGLTRLEAGDSVVVVRDGRPVTFAVYDIVTADKDQFPGDRVYADTQTPELRLITCGGALDRVSGHYEDNVIVFARAVSA